MKFFEPLTGTIWFSMLLVLVGIIVVSLIMVVIWDKRRALKGYNTVQRKMDMWNIIAFMAGVAFIAVCVGGVLDSVDECYERGFDGEQYTEDAGPVYATDENGTRYTVHERSNRYFCMSDDGTVTGSWMND